jgi:hypothetical protein
MSIKNLIVAAAALTAALGTGLAQARPGPDVQWSVTIGAPAPVYSTPYPAYPAAYPVYSAPYPVYRQPAPAYRAYPQYQHPTRWDRDGDGIPNRYDRNNRAWGR